MPILRRCRSHQPTIQRSTLAVPKLSEDREQVSDSLAGQIARRRDDDQIQRNQGSPAELFQPACRLLLAPGDGCSVTSRYSSTPRSATVCGIFPVCLFWEGARQVDDRAPIHGHIELQKRVLSMG